jgi:SPP1 family predicted phage head-tail adaptor
MPVDTSIVKSGDLNRRIAIQAPVNGTPDGQGGFTQTYQTLPGCSSVPAAMDYSNVPRKGDETFFAQQMYPTAFVIFKIRYRPSVNIKDGYRVVYGNRTFRIRSVTVPKERRTAIVLQCEELQAKGSTH